MSDATIELKETMEAISTSMERFKANHENALKEEREHRENLERKVNLLKLTGGESVSDTDINPVETFHRALKSWNPNRSHDLQGFDYSEYKAAFTKYLRYGIDSLTQEQRKSMSVSSDPDGGYLAPVEYVRVIQRTENANSVMRQIARVMPAGGRSVEFPASLTQPSVGWVGETGSRSESSGPGVGKLSFEMKEIYSMPEATQTLIDDAAFDIDSFMAEEIGLAFAQDEDAQYIAGATPAVPRGFTSYPTEATSDSAGTRARGVIEHIPTGQAGAWPTTDAALYDKLIDVVHALRPGYRKNAKWVMPTAAISRLRKMKTATTSEPIWQPSLIEGQPDRLLGYPVVEAEQMPGIAANSLSVAFADWKRAYWIFDRLGVRILRDPYTNKPFVRFYTTKRTDGGVADSKAIKLLKFSAT